MLILARDIDDLLELGREAEAKPLEIEAITIYTNEADKYIKAHCAYLLSRTYGIHNRANLQLEYLFQAEELLTEIGEKDLLKPVYISVAIVYEWLMTNSEKALEYEYKELNLRKEINYYERVAYTYLLISESLLGLKRIQDFPPEYKDYLKVGGVKGSLFFDAELLWVKARMLQAQGKSKEAQSVFQESISAYQKANDPIGGIWPSMDLAESFRGDGDIKNAIKHALIAYEWASIDKLSFLKFRAADLLSQLYEQSGDKSKAFDYLKQYRAIKDENEKLNSAARISELEVQSILNKRQREIEILESESQLKEQENKTQRIWLFSIAGALASLVFLSFILVRNNRQKQKANQVLNSKNKELEIEAALERVRSASMAMHKSEDLVNVATVMYNVIKNLGITQSAQCGFALINEEKKLQELWGSQTDSNLLTHFILPLTGDQVFLERYEAWKRKEPFFSQKLDAQQLKKHLEVAMPDTEITEEEKRSKLDMPETTYFHFGNFSHGYLQIIASKPLDKEQTSILVRFAKVFEQSYTRFLDLQKAEEQAREAQIEAGLERVRSRSMAMHKSDELEQVVEVLTNQFRMLNSDTVTCWIALVNVETNTMEIWNHTDMGSPKSNYTVNGKDYHTFQSDIDAFKNKERFRQFSFEKEAAKRILKEQLEFELVVPEESRDYHQLHYRHNFGFIGYASWSEPDEQGHSLLQRFAKVFEQTYTRFLDLQKAEAQAREAQIETGLERVRSRSMAMHKSEELSEVVTLVYEEIKPFGFATAGVELILIDEKNELQQYWLSGDQENKIIECFNIPTSIHPHFQKQWKAWKDQIPRLTLTLEGQEKKAFDQLIFTKTDFKNLSDDVKEFILNHGNVDVFSHAIMKYGLLEAVDSSPLSEEKFVILERFAKVFEQTYTRFLDLQKAEAQAREARIEAALERVRSRTMAMRRSDELADAATILFQQVKALGVPQWVCGFCIFEIDDKEFTWYPGSRDGDILTPCKVPLMEHPVFIQMNESRKRGDELYVYEIAGEIQAGNYRYMMTLPGMRESLQNILDAGLSLPEFQINHLANFSHGNLTFITYEPFPEMHDVFKRFAKVFEQTYTRFLDLQKAEAQAREAIKRASVDRVRAEIASMRTTSDLERIQPLIWNELKTLGVPFIRCGVFIMDEGKQQVQTMLSTPEGKAIATFHVPFEFDLTIITNGVHLLAQKESLYRTLGCCCIYQSLDQIVFPAGEFHGFTSDRASPGKSSFTYAAVFTGHVVCGK